jgi:hypothetical protein
MYRNQCNACFEISKDIEALKFVLKRPSNNALIIEGICEDLGASHLPYSWIESHCDQIVDEYSGQLKLKLNSQ